jgi:RimJ/RimL family protein N-acetyltransferase
MPHRGAGGVPYGAGVEHGDARPGPGSDRVDEADLYPPVRGRLGDVTTERLDLRRVRLGDEELLGPLFADPDVWHFPLGRGLTADETLGFVRRHADAWDAQGFDVWLASERATGRTVGYVGLTVPTFLPEVLPAVEVGWRLTPAAWGRGYATEGGRAALAAAFTTLGLDRVLSIIQVGNDASVAVARRLGMRVERRVLVPPDPDDDRGRGEALPADVFVLGRADWEATAGGPATGRS